MNDLINIYNWATEKGYTTEIVLNKPYANMTIRLSKGVWTIQHIINEEQLFNDFEIDLLLKHMDDSFDNFDWSKGR